MKVRKEITRYKTFLVFSHCLLNLFARLFECSNISKSSTLERINFLNSIRGDPGFLRGLREKRNERKIRGEELLNDIVLFRGGFFSPL